MKKFTSLELHSVVLCVFWLLLCIEDGFLVLLEDHRLGFLYLYMFEGLFLKFYL